MELYAILHSLGKDLNEIIEIAAETSGETFTGPHERLMLCYLVNEDDQASQIAIEILESNPGDHLARTILVWVSELGGGPYRGFHDGFYGSKGFPNRFGAQSEESGLDTLKVHIDYIRANDFANTRYYLFHYGDRLFRRGGTNELKAIALDLVRAKTPDDHIDRKVNFLRPLVQVDADEAIRELVMELDARIREHTDSIHYKQIINIIPQAACLLLGTSHFEKGFSWFQTYVETATPSGTAVRGRSIPIFQTRRPTSGGTRGVYAPAEISTTRVRKTGIRKRFSRCWKNLTNPPERMWRKSSRAASRSPSSFSKTVFLLIVFIIGTQTAEFVVS